MRVVIRIVTEDFTLTFRREIFVTTYRYMQTFGRRAVVIKMIIHKLVVSWAESTEVPISTVRPQTTVILEVRFSFVPTMLRVMGT